MAAGKALTAKAVNRGRPSKFTKALAVTICDRLARGESFDPTTLNLAQRLCAMSKPAVN